MTTKIDQPRSPEFEDALDAARLDATAPQPLCLGRWAEFTDYATPPTEAETKALCAPCPLLAICKKSATKHEKPSGGIRGGIAWLDGKQYHWLEKLGHLGSGDESSQDSN